MGSDSHKAWKQFLDPDVTRRRLIAASVYIASFEFFKGLIVQRVHGFFANSPSGTDDDGAAEYEEAVRGLNRSVVYASLSWLQNLGAIDENDIETFTRVKRFRNTFAHELFSMIVEQGMPEDFDERFAEMVELLNKIEVWWIREVYPPFDVQDVDAAEIAPGPVLGVKLLQELALGDDERSRAYLELFLGRSG